MPAMSLLDSDLLAATAVASALGFLPAPTHGTDDGGAVRPFHLAVAPAALPGLRRHIAEIRWPERETVDDRSQGLDLSKLQALLGYWHGDEEWRQVEARVNALPQFMTVIEEVGIHFMHFRSPHPDALPLLVTYGRPASIIDLLAVIGPLTEPLAFGGRADEAFDVVMPSMPGFGFSARPASGPWRSARIARAWAELMRRLGYGRYVALGDFGGSIAREMVRQQTAGLLGIHIPPAETDAARPAQPERFCAELRAACRSLR